MKKKILISAAGVVVIGLVVALALFQPWLIFVDERVDEDLPDAVAATDPGGLADLADPAESGETSGTPEPTETAEPSEPTESEPDEPVWTELATGEFIDAEHGTSGTARIVRNADGERQVWLEDLDTSNGPDLHVWITDQTSGGDCEGCFDSWGISDDGAYVALGALKGNQGDQRYDIPDDAALGDMTSVVIWCDRFNVAFGSAAIA